MINYKEKLEKIVNELLQHKDIQVTDYYIGKGWDPKKIEEILLLNNIKITKALVEFYSQVNGAVIIWELKENADIKLRHTDTLNNIKGFINIFRLDEIFTGGEILQSPAWSEAMSDQDALEDLKNFKPFDQNDDDSYIGFLVNDNFIEDKLFYIQREKEVIDTKSDISVYLDALQSSRGFLWWQSSFALRPSGFNYDDMYYYISQLFPDEKFDVFK